MIKIKDLKKLYVFKRVFSKMPSSPFALRSSPFALRSSPFALRSSPFALRSSPFALRSSLFALRLSLCLGVVFFAWMGTRWITTIAAQGSAPPPAATAPAVEKAQGSFTVGATDVPGAILITGELRAANSRDIIVPRTSSGFAASVTFLAPEGAHMKQGQRILEFDASAILSQKDEVQRKLEEAKLKIKKTKADLQAQRCDLLVQVTQAAGSLKEAELDAKIPKDLLPENEYQKNQVTLERAKLTLDRAKEKLINLESSMPAQMALVELDQAQAEVDLKKTEADLALLQVDAPQDGIIIYSDNWGSNRKIQVGDTLFPGMSVLTLPDLSSMEVIGYVYDTELRFLSTGMVCDLGLDAVPGKSWRGKIAALTSVANRKGFASQHKVFKATIRLDGMDPSIMKPGMTVRVEVPVSLASRAIAIPREYIGLDAQGHYYVRKGIDAKTAVIQIVKVGAFGGRLVQILDGLRAGDKILPLRSAAEVSS